jgi:hypothetical protein
MMKCVFILIMVRFLSLFETKYEKLCTQLMEKYMILISMYKVYCSYYFSFTSVTFPSTLKFLKFFSTGF